MFEFHVLILLYNFSYSKALLKIMKEYLLKQPKATRFVFIACKINLGLIRNNGNPGGRGGLWPWKSGWEGGVKKPCHLSGGGGGGFFLE